MSLSVPRCPPRPRRCTRRRRSCTSCASASTSRRCARTPARLARPPTCPQARPPHLPVSSLCLFLVLCLSRVCPPRSLPSAFLAPLASLPPLPYLPFFASAPRDSSPLEARHEARREACPAYQQIMAGPAHHQRIASLLRKMDKKSIKMMITMISQRDCRFQNLQLQ